MSDRILLVDDEETLRYVLKETLVNEGYDVDVAKDGFQALERFKLMPCDLLITDIKMHGMDGLQLIREIKKNDSNLKTIIITAYGSLETVKEAMRLGVVEFISKPFKLQEIKDIITKILCDYGSSQEIDSETTQWGIGNDGGMSMTDDLLAPTGLSYYFGGPASQPKNTIIFDFVATNSNRAALIFGNVNGQNGKHREWWENKQIGIMIKTLFRSKQGNTPKKIMGDINNFLYKNILPHINVSILCARIDKKKKEINFVNNGRNLVCSIFAPNGRADIMESSPSYLGANPETEIFERSMPYLDNSRLVLSNSNAISKIMENGSFIEQAMGNVLDSIKCSRHAFNRFAEAKKAPYNEIDLSSAFSSEKEINFDDEAVLMVNLDWD